MVPNIENEQRKYEFFEDLFRQHHKTLRSYAMWYVKDINAAEDVVQDVFFELWKNPTVNLHQNLKAYLFKAAYKRSLNFLTNKYNRSKISLNSSSKLEEYLDTLMDQDDSLVSNELLSEIQMSVDKLPQHCKDIFILRRTYELKNREIAEQLGVSVKAIEKQISKSLLLIRQHLKSRGYL